MAQTKLRKEQQEILEGTDILSTGEAGGSKYLREDGDGTCSWQTIAGGGDALVADPLSQFAATTSAQLAGVISDETGTGSLVFGTAPTFVTSITIGAATITEAELEILDGATLTTTELNYVDGVTSDIQTQIDGKSPTAGNASLVTTGALNSGSITSGFGSIDNGASAITTTGVITGGTLEATSDVSAGDNAAIGYTASDGLVLTGQGSATDFVLKNDAGGIVLSLNTGTRDLVFGIDGGAANFILSEKASIQLDPAGGADGDYSGITFTATAGATVAFGDVVYLDSADSEWKLVDADAVGTSGTVAVAICVSSGTDGNPVTLMSHGIIRADAGFPTLTVGAPVYISTTGTTTNTVTVTAPSGADDVVRVMGFALTANEMIFSPSSDHITHTG